MVCKDDIFSDFGAQGPHLRREWDGNLPPYRGNGSMETADVLEAEKWFLGIMDVVDEAAKVRFSLVETVFTGQSAENQKLLRVEALGESPVALDDGLSERSAIWGGLPEMSDSSSAKMQVKRLLS